MRNSLYCSRQSLVKLFIILCLALPDMNSEAACVWKIQDDKAAVYLAGSIHLLRDDDVIPHIYEEVYNKVGHVVFEVEPHLLNTPAILAAFRRAGLCEPGQNLSDSLNEENRKWLEHYCRDYPNSAADIHQFRPWKAGMMIVLNQLKRLGLRAGNGVDYVYYMRAVHDNKATASLENPIRHITLLSELSENEQNLFFKDAVMESQQLEDTYQKIKCAWERGDESVLNQWFGGSSAEESSIFQNVLLQRNLNWVNRLEKYLHGSDAVMVVVGVAHLVGDGSLIDLLTKRGYTICKLNESMCHIK